MCEFGGEVTEKDVRGLSGFLRRGDQQAHAIVFSNQVEPKISKNPAARTKVAGNAQHNAHRAVTPSSLIARDIVSTFAD